MKREILSFNVQRSKKRAQFLFNDGEFRPKTEKSGREYRRREKHRKQDGAYEDRFYR